MSNGNKIIRKICFLNFLYLIEKEWNIFTIILPFSKCKNFELIISIQKMPIAFEKYPHNRQNKIPRSILEISKKYVVYIHLQS